MGRQYHLLDNQHHLPSTALPHNVKLKITITEPAITTFAPLRLLLLFPQRGKVREREQWLFTEREKFSRRNFYLVLSLLLRFLLTHLLGKGKIGEAAPRSWVQHTRNTSSFCIIIIIIILWHPYRHLHHYWVQHTWNTLPSCSQSFIRPLIRPLIHPSDLTLTLPYPAFCQIWLSIFNALDCLIRPHVFQNFLNDFTSVNTFEYLYWTQEKPLLSSSMFMGLWERILKERGGNIYVGYSCQ